jgi:ribosomal protein S26
MEKMKSVPILNKLNKVINGSQSVIEAIDNSSSINHEKAIKASMLNSILLAEILKEILKELVEDDYINNPSSNKAVNDLMNMFGMK